ncbi:gliding motility lipoprotein GldH [Nonlabens ponticola]|uniref:Gliding motility lipoprotein GldH n=2 Tax=Nonlabens ponticola TaxID=2496866 RepID=A0A3S9N154_9FLAO|nr:gliding motility lipoprotein GldH [Nonlabens ponticola]
MRNYVYIWGVLCLCLLTSCDDQLVDSDTVTIAQGSWDYDAPVEFEITPPDSINDYDVFFYVRNDQQYAFKNLWLISQLKFPEGKIVTDTLQYEMADSQGRFLGTGKDLIENKLWYKRGVSFRESGTHNLTIKQAMRRNGDAQPLEQLDGVLDVGYIIEKHMPDGNN